MTEPPEQPNQAQQSANEIFALAGEEDQERERLSAKCEQGRPASTRERVVLASLAAGVPVLVALVLTNVVGLSYTSLFETPPSASLAREEAQGILDALVLDIEAFSKDYQELPESLVEIGVPARGRWSYAVTGQGSYRVGGTLYGQRVSFEGSTAARRSMKDRR